MSYATQADITKRISEEILIQLTDDDDTGAVDTTKVAAALEAADVEIEGYLGTVYSVPLSAPVPPIITAFAADIAIVNLYNRRQGPPGHWKEIYENRISFFEKVAEKRITLGAGAPDDGDDVQITSEERIFSRDSLKNY